MANNLLSSSVDLYAAEGRLSVHRSSFDHVEPNARLVIVGITPGAQQRDLANAAFAQATGRGLSCADASRAAKVAASFGGTMRNNLVAMLDHSGAARMLRISSTALLFDPATRGLAHFTSALRYPVFIDGENYNGQVPMLGSLLLRSMVESLLADEVRQLPHAVWQPLGDKPAGALHHLADLGLIDRARIAPPLPHPSGANAERITYFLGRKQAERLSTKTNAAKIDSLRNASQLFYAKRTNDGWA